MTLRIYYTDPYAATFTATVTRVLQLDGRPAVVLDATAFYPTSGGQPFDTGRLGTAAVLDVIDLEDGDVAHVLSEPLAAGARVQGAIDWARRFDHMQQHTGQHVLSAAFARALGNRTLSFHMGADAATIDLEREASPAEIAKAEDDANAVVWEDRPVSIRFATPEEAAALPLRKEPKRTGTLRLVDVTSYDLSACGGTHVASTGAIGVIAALGWERFRGGTRVTFACGGRALRAIRSYRDIVTAASRALSVLPAEVPGAIERLQADAKDVRKALRGFQALAAAAEGERLVAAAPEVNGIRIVVHAAEGHDAASLKVMASAIAGKGRVAAVLVSGNPAAVVVARAQDVALDAGAVLKGLTARFGGKGGGKPDLAQGGGLAGDRDAILAAARDLVRDGLAT